MIHLLEQDPMIYLKSKPAVLLERAFRHLGAAARTTNRTANFAVGEHVDVQNVQNVQLADRFATRQFCNFAVRQFCSFWWVSDEFAKAAVGIFAAEARLSQRSTRSTPLLRQGAAPSKMSKRRARCTAENCVMLPRAMSCDISCHSCNSCYSCRVAGVFSQVSPRLNYSILPPRVNSLCFHLCLTQSSQNSSQKARSQSISVARFVRPTPSVLLLCWELAHAELLSELAGIFGVAERPREGGRSRQVTDITGGHHWKRLHRLHRLHRSHRLGTQWMDTEFINFTVHGFGHSSWAPWRAPWHLLTACVWCVQPWKQKVAKVTHQVRILARPCNANIVEQWRSQYWSHNFTSLRSGWDRWGG